MPIFIVFGGLTPIDWISKPLLQSFNVRSFFVVFGLKSVHLKLELFSYEHPEMDPKMHFVLVYMHLRPVPNPTKPCA